MELELKIKKLLSISLLLLLGCCYIMANKLLNSKSST